MYTGMFKSRVVGKCLLFNELQIKSFSESKNVLFVYVHIANTFYNIHSTDC